MAKKTISIKETVECFNSQLKNSDFKIRIALKEGILD